MSETGGVQSGGGGGPGAESPSEAEREEGAGEAGGGTTAGGAEALPVIDAVHNYEKITRIGEGTFGIVCKRPLRAALALFARVRATLQLGNATQQPKDVSHQRARMGMCAFQTRQGTSQLGRWSP